MSKPDSQYVLYEITSASEPNERGLLPTSLISVSTPIPSWLCGNSTLTGSGIFVIYYSIAFHTLTTSALYQNEFEIPATRIRGNQNHGYIILSTAGTMKTHIHIRASESNVKKGIILITELSFHDEKTVVE